MSGNDEAVDSRDPAQRDPAQQDTVPQDPAQQDPAAAPDPETPRPRAAAQGAVNPQPPATPQHTAPQHTARPQEPENSRLLLSSPFRTGLLAGLGLVVAYAIYLSVSTIVSTLEVLGISAIIAIGLDQVVEFLMRHGGRHGLRRGSAVAITYLGFLALFVAAFYAIIPPIVQQASTLIGRLPHYLNNLLTNPTMKSLDDRFGLIEKLKDLAGHLGTGAASGVFTAAGVVVDIFVVLVLTLYFLVGLPRITLSAYRLVPASRRGRVREIGGKVIDQLGGYLGGATITALQAGVIAGLFAWIVGLPYPLAIAAGAAVLDLVPVVGPIIIGVSMALLGFTQSLLIGIIAGLFYLAQHLFESYWFHPRIMRRTVHISTGAVIVAIVVGAALLGIIGAVLAVPMAAVIQLIVREVLMPRQDRV